MKISATLSIVVTALLFIHSAQAQTVDDIVPNFTPEQEADLGKAFGTYTSATAVFTGRNSVSSGNFSFDNGGGDFEVTNLPLSYTFGEKGDETRYRIRGAFGLFNSRSTDHTFSDAYAEAEPELPEELQGLVNEPDKRKDRATSISLGGSIVYEPSAGLTIEPAFDVIWSHVKRRFEYNNFLSALVGSKYDRDLFNQSTESISYSPSLAVDYDVPLGNGYSITPSLLYTHFWTYDIWSKSRFANFEVDSGVLRTKMASNIPLPYTPLGVEMAVSPFVIRTQLFGAVQNSLDENALYDLGADLVFTLKDAWLTKLYVGGAYILADDLDGYRVNLWGEF
jgi:hypothetical protein